MDGTVGRGARRTRKRPCLTLFFNTHDANDAARIGVETQLLHEARLYYNDVTSGVRCIRLSAQRSRASGLQPFACVERQL